MNDKFLRLLREGGDPVELAAGIAGAALQEKLPGLVQALMEPLSEGRYLADDRTVLRVTEVQRALYTIVRGLTQTASGETVLAFVDIPLATQVLKVLARAERLGATTPMTLNAIQDQLPHVGTITLQPCLDALETEGAVRKAGDETYSLLKSREG